MHSGSMLRMKWFLETYASQLPLESIKVLDVGSCDVNGSYRGLFNSTRYSYTGVDMAEGPNVDLVLKNSYKWSEIASDTFDIVITGQAFEHMEFFWIVMSEIARVTKKNGLICIIAPNAYREHRYPVDCYRFLTDGMVALARYASLQILHAHTNAAPARNFMGWYGNSLVDSMLVAQKPYEGDCQFVNISEYTCIPIKHNSLTTPLVPYKKVKQNFLKWLSIRVYNYFH